MGPYDQFRVGVHVDWAREFANVYIWRPAGNDTIEKVSRSEEGQGDETHLPFFSKIIPRGVAMADNEPTLVLPAGALEGIRDELDKLLGQRESKETVTALKESLDHERARLDKVLDRLLPEGGVR